MGTEGIWIPLLIGGAVVATTVVAGQSGKGSTGGFKMPVSTAASSNPTKTAAAVTGQPATEQEKLNKRLAASQLTKDWGTAKLSKPGLLGLGATP